MEASTVRVAAGKGRAMGGARFLRLRSDEQLVALFRGGSEEAFAVLHDRYRQRLFGYVRQMLNGGSRGDAEDVLQDVFVRAYFTLRADDRPMAARAWLYRVAHNRCIDSMRRPAPAPCELIETAAGDLHDPLEQASQREDLAQLVTDLQRLPEQQRSALLLRELEGLKYEELTAVLGCTLAAVKSLLVRARMGMAEAVEARETACADIRVDLAETCERGARASGRARRHIRDCEGCRAYREALAGASRGLGALAPSHGPLMALAKLVGLGGSGAAASGSAVGGGLLGGGAISGGGVVAVGGGAVAATATKVAVVVCCVAGVAGGAREIKREVVDRAPAAKPAAARAPAGSSRVVAIAPGRDERAGAVKHRAAAPAKPATDDAAVPVSTEAPPADSTPLPTPVTGEQTGGALGPEEPGSTETLVAPETVKPPAGLPIPGTTGTVAPTGSGTTGPGGGATSPSSGSRTTTVTTEEVSPTTVEATVSAGAAPAVTGTTVTVP